MGGRTESWASGEPRAEAEMETFKLACGVSYVGQGGQNERSCGHSLDTGKV